MSLKNSLLWIAAPLVSFIAAFLVIYVCQIMFLLSLPFKIPLLLSNNMDISIYGVVAAFTFVATGSYVVPNYKSISAILLFVLGAYISWPILSDVYEPDSVTPDYFPLLATYMSGLVGIAFVHLTMKYNTRLQIDAATPRD